MGGQIEIQHDRKVLIQGVDELHGTTHTIIPDRIEVGTYIIAGAITKGELEIKNINFEHIENLLLAFDNLGIDMHKDKDSL
jgi:UDP-N-acetylglucosamine 1-carboxyvinyltransferase